jgi:hypothetical protein
LDSSGADILPPPQPTAIDAVEMLLEDRLLKGLAGSLIRQDAGKRLAEVAATIQAVGLAALQQDHGMP